MCSKINPQFSKLVKTQSRFLSDYDHNSRWTNIYFSLTNFSVKNSFGFHRQLLLPPKDVISVDVEVFFLFFLSLLCLFSLCSLILCYGGNVFVFCSFLDKNCYNNDKPSYCDITKNSAPEIMVDNVVTVVQLCFQKIIQQYFYVTF